MIGAQSESLKLWVHWIEGREAEKEEGGEEGQIGREVEEERKGGAGVDAKEVRVAERGR